MPELEMREITKAFPGILALDAVSFDCAPGEVHAICGENGAGKSTLIKVLGGVYRPDSGTIRIGGREAAFTHPVEARRAGISIIHQELSLLPERSVAENIHLALEPSRFGILDRTTMRAQARRLLERVGSTASPDQRAGDLSIAQQQTVEIAKALAPGPRIMVMDEPTAALDDAEARHLLDLVRRLRADGVAVIYISHRMAEVQRVADRVTVLKDGRHVATGRLEEMPTDRIVRLMVGRELADFYPPRAPTCAGPVLLEIQGGGNDLLDGIGLAVCAGEIVGVAGLDGSGKTALARAIFGDAPFERGSMRLDGRTISIRSPRAAIAHGIGYLPDDRKREGLLLLQTLRDNIMLALRAFGTPLRPPASGKMADAAGRPQAAPARRAGRALRPGNPHAVRRQPAEGHHRPLARPRPATAAVLRTHARHRRGLEGRDLPHHARVGG